MLKYALELRNKFILVTVTFFSTLLISYYYKNVLLFLVTQMHIDQEGLYFIFTNIVELFYCYLRIVFFFSGQISFWYLFYHILVFFSFALYIEEFKTINFFFRIITFCWVFSIFVSTYILIPYSWSFFSSFKDSQEFYFEARVSEYLDFFINVQLLSLIYCQLFLLLLSMLNIYQTTVWVVAF